METAVCALLGAMMGLGASRTHPVVNPGVLLAIATGALGGLLGSSMFGSSLAPTLADSEMAGAAAAAGIGGMIAAMVAGVARRQLTLRLGAARRRT